VAQVSSLLELLKRPAKVNIVGSDQVGGLDCAVLEVTPTAEAAADWVLSQDRGGSGPSWMWWRTGPYRSKEIYVKAFTGGSAKFWIDQNSSRVLQVDVSLEFVVKPGDAKRVDVGIEMSKDSNELDVGFDEIIREVHGRLQFSQYGHSPRVTPPRQALEAPARW